MVYKLIVTERAEEQLDECLYYLVYRLGNNIAAEHLLTCIETVSYTHLTLPTTERV